jgi:hypothetical protein
MHTITTMEDMQKGKATRWMLASLSFFSLSLPTIAQATIPPSALALIGKLYTVILNPIIVLLFALAFFYFMYGILQMVWYGDSEAEREKGRSAILWGIIGMFIMFSVFTIIRILVNSIGGNVGTVLQTV